MACRRHYASFVAIGSGQAGSHSRINCVATCRMKFTTLHDCPHIPAAIEAQEAQPRRAGRGGFCHTTSRRTPTVCRNSAAPGDAALKRGSKCSCLPVRSALSPLFNSPELRLRRISTDCQGFGVLDFVLSSTVIAEDTMLATSARLLGMISVLPVLARLPKASM